MLDSFLILGTVNLFVGFIDIVARYRDGDTLFSDIGLFLVTAIDGIDSYTLC